MPHEDTERITLTFTVPSAIGAGFIDLCNQFGFTADQMAEVALGSVVDCIKDSLPGEF